IAQQFKEIGLQPAYGESYFQPVREISSLTRLEKDKLTVKGSKKTVNIVYGEDVVVWSHRNAEKVDIKNAEIVFAGFGIDDPKFNWNDFDGLDVKGKIILAMVNDPGYYNNDLFRGKNMTYNGRWCYKFEEAERKGALGCLVIHNTAAASYSFQVCRTSYMQRNISLLNENDNKDVLGMRGWIAEDAARAIFASCGMDYDKEAEKAKQPGFKGFPLKAKMNGTLLNKVEIGETCNVVGVLPGTDLKDECVVMSAHWDHLGVGEPVDGDPIYNGARDNASGVAAMLMQARQFVNSPLKPRRTLIFVAVTSEEGGLFGSEWYCEHPLIPLSRTAANINMDGAAPQSLTRDIVLMFTGKSDLDALVHIAAAAQGRYARVVNDDTAGYYYRADHFNFCKRGVPAVLVGGGNDYVDKSILEKKTWKNTYHQPADEYSEDWDLEGAMENQNLIHAIMMMIANQDNMPKWTPQSDFQRQADK
ncbi:MAG: M20/M25/M40 family metallo-hydrolase, partial [Bacteroidales bacterium]|nr:M20/M25/M40 family metallo-hydrolase [Bacteroidales bacterium]